MWQFINLCMSFLSIAKMTKDWQVTSLSVHSSLSTHDSLGVVPFNMPSSFLAQSKMLICNFQTGKFSPVSLSMFMIPTLVKSFLEEVYAIKTRIWLWTNQSETSSWTSVGFIWWRSSQIFSSIIVRYNRKRGRWSGKKKKRDLSLFLAKS